MNKRYFTMILIIGLFMSSRINAAIIDSGNCAGTASYVNGKYVYSNNACTYTIDDKGVLTISGSLDSGSLAYDAYGTRGEWNSQHTVAPWGDYRDVVTKVNIDSLRIPSAIFITSGLREKRFISTPITLP